MSVPASIPGFSRPVTVDALVTALVVLGVSALLGGAGLIYDPSGDAMGLPVILLSGSPFENYMIPGLALFFVLGVFPLAVGYGLHLRRPWAWPGVLVVGLAVLVWFAVQAEIIGWGNPLQWVYLLLGLGILLLAILPSVRRYARTSDLLDSVRLTAE
jgi:uncharacterized membrane-anchored protein